MACVISQNLMYHSYYRWKLWWICSDTGCTRHRRTTCSTYNDTKTWDTRACTRCTTAPTSAESTGLQGQHSVQQHILYGVIKWRWMYIVVYVIYSYDKLNVRNQHLPITAWGLQELAAIIFAREKGSWHCMIVWCETYMTKNICTSYLRSTIITTINPELVHVWYTWFTTHISSINMSSTYGMMRFLYSRRCVRAQQLLQPAHR